MTSNIFLNHIIDLGQPCHLFLKYQTARRTSVPPTKDQMVTSFSSKSELALNLSSDGNYLTFNGVPLANETQLTFQKLDTPGVKIDPTNPVGENVYRVIAQVDGERQISLYGDERLQW